LPVWPIEVSWVCWARAEVAAAALELAGGFGLAAFLLALLKAQPKDLAVGDAAAEGVDGDATLAQISATVRLLKRDIRTAAITSPISAPRLVPAASAPIGLQQAGSCSSGNSSIASAFCNGGAVGVKRSGASSIHTSRSRSNSRTGVGR
jgi:hypothetical protein